MSGESLTYGIDFSCAIRCLEGVRVGDSIGLVYEGLSAQRGRKLYPFPLRQRLCFGRGYPSDDSIQSALVVAALAQTHEPAEFQRNLASKLRAWFLCAPPGIGLATVRACMRLCVGFGPMKSGVDSAGNGAAMRSAVIGAAFHCDPRSRVAFTEASARITHTHPLAIQGAQLVSLAAALSASGFEAEFMDQANALAPDWPWDESWPAEGPTGFVVHTVNAAISVWKSGSIFRDSLERVVTMGGDTDTVGAIVGGLVTLRRDCPPIPEEWQQIGGWPQPSDLAALGQGRRVPFSRIAATHALSLPAILAHGFRRLAPPY